jgi:hypothetical protein
MMLRGERETGAKRLIGRVITAGSCVALEAFGADSAALAKSELQLKGAVVVGDGNTPQANILARAADWLALDLSNLEADYLLLLDAPTEPAMARVILRCAADARMKVLVRENDKLRRLDLEDLVGRPLRDVDWRAIKHLIAGKRILITGGGGSIGSEIARRVTAIGGAERLTLLDASEYNLYRMHRELPDAAVVLADVRDAASMKRWFSREKPQLVFHAAALKQVPVVEEFPSEGVLTNVCGLKHVADACAGVGADLIFVSTDKAVDPSGAMGASKRFGEIYCQALDREERRPACAAGAAWQRAGLRRLCDPNLPTPARQRRPADGDRRGNDALLPIDPASSGFSVAGGGDRRRRRTRARRLAGDRHG